MSDGPRLDRLPRTLRHRRISTRLNAPSSTKGTTSREPRPRPLAVRQHEHLPLPLRPGDHRAGLPRGPVADGLVPQRRRHYRRLARFFGSLLLINVAVGVVGLDSGVRVRHELVGLLAPAWQRLRRAAGHGGPGRLLLGVGLPRHLDLRWNRLSKKAHLACIWLVAAGTMLSAAFIMAANSWINTRSDSRPTTARTNPSSTTSGPSSPIRSSCGATPMSSWPPGHGRGRHARAVSAWQLRRQNQVESFRRTAVISLVVLLPSVALELFVGSEPASWRAPYQPMKIAAAQAWWQTYDSQWLSIFQIGGGENDETRARSFRCPTSCRSWPPTMSCEESLEGVRYYASSCTRYRNVRTD